MREFVVVLPDEVIKYKHFFWQIKKDGVMRICLKLTGMIVSEEGLKPMYQPLFSVEKRLGEFYFEMHLSRWASLIFLFDRQGIHAKYYDFRKDFENK